MPFLVNRGLSHSLLSTRTPPPLLLVHHATAPSRGLLAGGADTSTAAVTSTTDLDVENRELLDLHSSSSQARLGRLPLQHPGALPTTLITLAPNCTRLASSAKLRLASGTPSRMVLSPSHRFRFRLDVNEKDEDGKKS
ncbi:hypothetical protein DEO72_LG6g676 [Vigna unguiculata]|uniref:Uncharacterized protein n=1 Tax=Vigna unguiculata TaxID=3917 RepID=A0A4D6M621_VIGUN|nr:hypothetical protein DEO72_LG6g676 [Vigna unguiculata]